MSALPDAIGEKKRERLILAGILLYSLFLFFYLLQGLGRLSLWMDEGFHYLAAQGILQHGYPLFPSGHVYYKAILYCYIVSGFAFLFGLNAFSLRLFSVICFAALIPLTYVVAKKFFSRIPALLAAALLSLSAWGIEYARAGLYFAPLQLFYLLGLYVFYLGYFEDRKKYKVWAWILFAMTPLIHQLGVGLCFCLPALLIGRGFKRFMKRDVLSLFLAVGLFYAFIQLHEFFFWKVGYVYERTDTSLRGMIEYFFSGFSFAYFQEFYRSFPAMSLVVLGGIFLYLAYRFAGRSADRASGGPAGAGWLYVYLNLLFPLLFLGFFRTHVQPRYLVHLYPLFVILCLAALFNLASIVGRALAFPFRPLRKVPVRRAVSLGLFLAMAIFVVEGVGPKQLTSIVGRQYKDRIQTDVLTRSGRFEHYDNQHAGEYVRRFLRKDDLVVAIHVVFQYIYAGRVDYWLWSGGPGTWDAWEQTPEGWKDFYVGARWINSLDGLQAVIDQNPDRRIWIITSPSIFRTDHISPDIAGFIRGAPEKLVYRAQDGMCEAYLWNDRAGEFTGTRRTFEGEWAQASPGRIDFSDDASKMCALLLDRNSRKAGSAPDVFSSRIPETFPAGRFSCVVRMKTDGQGADGGRLNLAVWSRKRGEKIRALSIAAADFPEAGRYKDFKFDFYLNREDRLELRFAVGGRGRYWLDYVDILPDDGKESP
ncbi:MAG: glycosyltransferase family 39 protein [Acidobacteriota bacterium]|nr:glycosyltransferase family 39 protein [Acidobacteriota bacterium]